MNYIWIIGRITSYLFLKFIMNLQLLYIPMCVLYKNYFESWFLFFLLGFTMYWQLIEKDGQSGDNQGFTIICTVLQIK